MNTQFPRTDVAGISLPRMIIGSNWILGYSHTSPAADKMIKSRYADADAAEALLDAYGEYGIDAIMAPMEEGTPLITAARRVQEKTGRKMILIDTPILNVEDTRNGRAEAEARVRESRRLGATFCLPHHSSAEQLVNKLKGTIDRLPDYLGMIRDNGMIPGLSAHMPELIVYSDANGYDVQTYIQIYNCMGFMMQVEIEQVNRIIWSAKKPVMTIKSMAAGRVTPFVGITFSFATLRPGDMVTVGAFTAEEAHEDVEIAMAAIERRQPRLEGRSTPNRTAALGG
jgi:hypothetical protein